MVGAVCARCYRADGRRWQCLVVILMGHVAHRKHLGGARCSYKVLHHQRYQLRLAGSHHSVRALVAQVVGAALLDGLMLALVDA